LPGQRARRWQVLSRGARYGLPTPSPRLVSATLDEPRWGNATVLAGDGPAPHASLRRADRPRDRRPAGSPERP